MDAVAESAAACRDLGDTVRCAIAVPTNYKNTVSTVDCGD